METIILIAIFVLICVGYGVIRTIGSKKDRVYNAKAGGAGEGSAESDIIPILTEQSKVVKLPNGYYANTHKFHRLKVNGNCMSPVNINDQEEWLAEKFNNNKSLCSQIKKGDVVLIYRKDKDDYKIRRVETIDAERNELVTYWYQDNGEKKVSSKNHGKDLIMGILRYRIA